LKKGNYIRHIRIYFYKLMAETKTRISIASIVDLALSPARIRRFMDRDWINRVHEEQNTKVKSQLMAIRKEGCVMTKPDTPKAPGRNASAADRTAYDAAKTTYMASLKTYNEFNSARYNNLELLHSYCRLLDKLLKARQKKDTTEAVMTEITNTLATLNDEVAPKHKNETDAEFNERKASFKKVGYLALRPTGTSLDKPDQINAEIERILHMPANKDLELFFEKDDISKDRIRFNDGAAVAIASFMEASIVQFFNHAVDETIEQKKKIIQPDHCVSEGIEKCSLFPLISNLMHYTALVDRQNRREEYNDDRWSAHAKAMQQAKMRAKQTKKPYARPKFNYITFSEQEVEEGYAVKEETADTENNVKTVYKWYGIDIDDATDTTERIKFTFYVNKICKTVLDERITSGDTDAGELRVSTSLKKFFSDLVIDFITRITPISMQLIDSRGVKTITEDIIYTVVKILLIDSYDKTSETIDLTPEHAELFKTTKMRVDKCKAHQTGVIYKEEEEADVDEPDVDEPDVEPPPIEDEPPATPAAKPAAAGKPTKK
jgi:histone H3/H4